MAYGYQNEDCCTASATVVGGKAPNPALANDVSVLLSRVYVVEDSVRKIAARLFGHMPEPDEGCSSAEQPVSDRVLEALRITARTIERLEELEKRLG